MDKKKNYVKGMSSDFAVSNPDDPTTKKIKKILRAKHPGYEKNSIDGEAFDSACETISFLFNTWQNRRSKSCFECNTFCSNKSI